MYQPSSFARFSCLLPLILLLGACDQAASEDVPSLPTYIVDVSGETFRIQVSDPAIVEIADSLLANQIGKIVHGAIQEGDGGFNDPYNWHLDPATISFPDLAIEICDGRPSLIEEDLDYWLDTVKFYCPWGAQIVGKE